MVPPEDKQEEGGYYSFCAFITPKELDLLVQTLRDQDPSLIGISFSSVTFGLARFVTQQLRKHFDVPIIWGGVDSSMNPETNIEYPDMLCIGEGEYPLRDLTNAMDRGDDVTVIPSIWVNRNGSVIRNPLMKLEDNLDNYPFPDFEVKNKTVIFDNEIISSPYPPNSHLYSNFIIMGSRGCPFNCTYCCSGHQRKLYAPDRFLRHRSPKNVVDELKYQIRNWPWPIERVEFYDDVLPAKGSWIKELAPLYGSEIGLPFFGYTHPTVGKPENLALLREAGMHYLIMGIQSGSQRVLNEILDRRHSKEKTLETARNILDSGAKLLVDFIGYNPLVTEADNIETLELICDLPKPCGIIEINPMAFYDKYRIQEIALKAGLKDQLERPKGVHAYQAKVTLDMVFWEKLHTLAHFQGMSKEHVMGLVNDQYLREHPEIFTETIAALYNATYLDGNPVADKDQYIQELRSRIAQIDGSRMIRLYRKIKNLFK